MGNEVDNALFRRVVVCINSPRMATNNGWWAKSSRSRSTSNHFIRHCIGIRLTQYRCLHRRFQNSSPRWTWIICCRSRHFLRCMVLQKSKDSTLLGEYDAYQDWRTTRWRGRRTVVTHCFTWVEITIQLVLGISTISNGISTAVTYVVSSVQNWRRSYLRFGMYLAPGTHQRSPNGSRISFRTRTSNFKTTCSTIVDSH